MDAGSGHDDEDNQQESPPTQESLGDAASDVTERADRPGKMPPTSLRASAAAFRGIAGMSALQGVGKFPELRGIAGMSALQGVGKFPELRGITGITTLGAHYKLPTSVASAFHSLLKSFWAGLPDGAALRELLRKHRLPSNLRNIAAISSDDVMDFTLTYGVSLYLVPNERIAAALLRASDRKAVRRILGDQRSGILRDCRAILEVCDQPETLVERDMALQALTALEADLYAPAQALAANILDTILAKRLEATLADAARRRRGESLADFKLRLEDLDTWQVYVAAAMWSTFQHYLQSQGDRVPHAFSRHATTHAVSRTQYSRRSAVQGMLAVTGAVGFMNGLG